VPNYLHQLQKESVTLLENGGLWKYSGDAHETLQGLAKNIWMEFSARGAQNRLPPPLIIMQRHFMKTHLCTVAEGPRRLIMLREEERNTKEMEELAAEF
jgi:hypothetical protein